MQLCFFMHLIYLIFLFEFLIVQHGITLRCYKIIQLHLIIFLKTVNTHLIYHQIKNIFSKKISILKRLDHLIFISVTKLIFIWSFFSNLSLKMPEYRNLLLIWFFQLYFEWIFNLFNFFFKILINLIINRIIHNLNYFIIFMIIIQ